MKTCIGCDKEFEKGLRKNSKICNECRLQNGKFRKKFVCEFCNIEFCRELLCDKHIKFCSTTCSNKFLHRAGILKNAMNEKTTMEHWIARYGEEGALEKKQQFKQTMSATCSGEKNPMFGKNYQTHGWKRVNTLRKGKTYEETYGADKARAIKDKQSLSNSGENNPAYGKVYKNAGRSVKGHYKGKYFRSLFEYSFMKHIESMGYDLFVDVRYEHFVIPYENDKGVKRTYTPDFYVIPLNAVFEVKPNSWLNNSVVIEKCAAAKIYFDKLGIEFKLVTEFDFRKLLFNEAKEDINVVWNEESFKYFKSKDNSL